MSMIIASFKREHRGVEVVEIRPDYFIVEEDCGGGYARGNASSREEDLAYYDEIVEGIKNLDN